MNLPPAPASPDEGVKYDDEKPDYTLLPWDALEEVVRCLEYGARKYARANWKKVPDAFNRYERAGFRHRIARVRGEEVDPESGCRHLAHEVCSLLFQMSLRPADPHHRPQEPRQGLGKGSLGA